MQILHYVGDRVSELPPEALADVLARQEGALWVDMTGPTAEDQRVLAEVFKFHPLAIEDTLKQAQRPKLEEYDGYFFMSLHAVASPGQRGISVTLQEIDLFGASRYVVTVHPHPVPALEETRVNLERMRTLVRDALVAQREMDVARTQYESALAQHETSQVELRQYPDRVRVAEAQLESDRSAVRVAEADGRQRQAELGLAKKKLTDATLRAPIGGAVARRHLNPGQYVPENTPVFTLMRSDPLKFTGTVAEHAALEVRPGQTVRLRAEPASGRTFAGRVTRVSPAVDVTSRTMLLEAEVPNREGLLKPGLFARGAVVLRQDRDVAFVPESAVSYFAGLTRVFVVADGTARERTVTLGTRKDGMIEAVTGVRAGEQVATSGLAQLQDGARVSTAPPGRRR